MIFSKKAQSIIEYTVVVILVIAGLILMRPYVIRAVNAHMKSWQDNVKDSMTETLTEAPPPAPPQCGDGRCTPPESLVSCCRDCGGGCGDGYCCPDTENLTTCESDCSVCGDGSCTGSETFSTCCADCTTCGDGCCCVGNSTCSTVGTPVSSDVGCLADCPQLVVCGDGTCQGSETILTCPQDCCPPLCGDGICNATCNENNINSSCYCTDCPPHCGDGVCNCGESYPACSSDCPPPACETQPCSLSASTPRNTCTGSCPDDCCIYMQFTGATGYYYYNMGLWTFDGDHCHHLGCRYFRNGCGICRDNDGPEECGMSLMSSNPANIGSGVWVLYDPVTGAACEAPTSGHCETNPSNPPCRCSSLSPDICYSTPGCTVDPEAVPCRPNCGNPNCYSCHDPNAPSMCQGCWNITNQGYCEAMCTGDCSIQSNHTCVWYGFGMCEGTIDCEGFGSDQVRCNWYTCCRWVPP